MGKGQRNKAKAAATYAAKKENRSNVTKTVIRIVCAVLIVAMLGALIGYGRCVNSGYYLRNTVSVASQNFEINNSMMTYFYNQMYNQIMDQYYYYLVASGLDPNTSLKNQISSMGGGTWFDYFMDQTVASVKEMLILAEAAKAAGVSLDADELKAIDDEIEYIKKVAKANGGVDYFVRYTYGFGVSLEDIKDVLLITRLSSKYYAQIMEELGEKFDKEDYDKYYADHTKELSFADILKYEFTYTPPKKDATATGTADKTTKAAATGTATSDATATGTAEDLGDETMFEFIQEYADKLAACKTPEEFKAYVEEYLLTVVYKDYEIIDDTKKDDATATGTKDKEEKKDATATGTAEKKPTVKQSKINSIIDGVVADRTTYKKDDEVSEWIFGGEAGQYVTKIFKDYDKKTDKYTLEVVMINNPMYRDDYVTKDMMHILLGVGNYGPYKKDADAKAKADEVLAAFKAGELTKEAFEKLAEKNTSDGGILYENVEKDKMADEIDKWIYDENRKAGDTDIVKTSYGYHVMYFVGDGEIAWELQADKLLIEEAYAEKYETYEKAHQITVDKAALQVIDG